MNRKWLAVLGIASMLAVVGLTGCVEDGGSTGQIASLNLSNQQNGIWVTGTGKVTVTPDIASLRVGVEAMDISVAAARNKAAEAMQQVMDALTAQGVDSKDIQTEYFNIYPVTSWDRETEKEVNEGYRVNNTVSVKIRDIEKVGTIIDAVADAGGDYTRINSIDFSIDDPSPYYGEAREAAMADAKAKAQQLASLSGETLGSVTYVSENTYTAPIAKRVSEIAYAEDAAGYPTSISAGEMDVTISLQVAYAIK